MHTPITEQRNTLLANTLNAQKHARWKDGECHLILSEAQVEYLEEVLLTYFEGKEKHE